MVLTFEQICDQSPFRVGQTTGVTLFGQLASMSVVVSVRSALIRQLKNTLDTRFDVHNTSQFQRGCKRGRMSGNACLHQEQIHQFGLSGQGVSLCQFHQKRVVLWCDSRWASCSGHH